MFLIARSKNTGNRLQYPVDVYCDGIYNLPPSRSGVEERLQHDFRRPQPLETCPSYLGCGGRCRDGATAGPWWWTRWWRGFVSALPFLSLSPLGGRAGFTSGSPHPSLHRSLTSSCQRASATAAPGASAWQLFLCWAPNPGVRQENSPRLFSRTSLKSPWKKK